jgi:hypothetical protein
MSAELFFSFEIRNNRSPSVRVVRATSQTTSGATIAEIADISVM